MQDENGIFGFRRHDSLHWHWSPGLVESVFFNCGRLPLVADCKEQEVDPGPEDGQRQPIKDFQYCRTGIDVEDRNANSTGKSEGGLGSHDNIEIAEGEEPDRVCLVQERLPEKGWC